MTEGFDRRSIVFTVLIGQIAQRLETVYVLKAYK
jgi:hypothetical protein